MFRWQRPVPGIVLLRIEPESPALKWSRLSAAITHYGDGLLGRFTVIDERKLRSRSLSGTE